MKFNIKFKYILFIILSFVFVMSDVGARNVGKIETKDYYDSMINQLILFKLKAKDKDTKQVIKLDDFTVNVAKRDSGQLDISCLDPCSQMGKNYSNTDNTATKKLGNKLLYLMNAVTYTVYERAAVAQIIGFQNSLTTCAEYKYYENGKYKVSPKKVYDDYAAHCMAGEHTSLPSLTNKEFYLELNSFSELKEDRVCKLYRDTMKQTGEIKQLTISGKEKVSEKEIEDSTGKYIEYKIEFKISDPSLLAQNSYYGSVAAKAAKLPYRINGNYSEDIGSWYSLSNHKDFTITRAELLPSALSITVRKKADSNASTVLYVNDHGDSDIHNVTIAKGYKQQTIAVRTSLFKDYYNFPSTNEFSVGKCSITIGRSKADCHTELVPDTSAKRSGSSSAMVPQNFCNYETVSQLNYDTNKFISNYSIKYFGFSSMPAFTLSPEGANCCDDYKNNTNFKNNVLKLEPNALLWEQAYDNYCIKKEQQCTYDPSTKSVFSSAFVMPYDGNGNSLLTAKFAFESLYCCDDYKNGTRGFSAVKTDLNWQNAYKTYCDGTTTEVTTSTACINPAPNSQTIVDNKINNCCLDDTHSYVQEVQLNDLFDNTKTHEGVTYFEPLPTCEGSDLDVAKGKINDTCDYYCTERLDIEVPGSTSADSGRYFKFNEIDGHASPKVDGYRRCRVTIKYDEWYNTYKQKLNELVSLFNDWQVAKANLKMYQDAKENRIRKTGTFSYDCVKCISPSQSEIDSCKSSCTSNNCSYCSECHDSTVGHGGGTYEYYEYNYPTVSYGKEFISNPTANMNFGYSFQANAAAVHHNSENHDSKRISDTGCSSGSKRNESGYNDYSAFSFDGTDSAESQARQAYQNKLQEIQTLQTQLNTCDRYLDDNYLYNLDPDVKFKYTQFFKNELGDPDSVITDVEYGDASCTTRKLDTASNAKDKIEGPTYSPNPGYTGVTNIAYSRLKNNLLLNQNPGLDNYTADMKFRYDKIYNTTCYWDNQSTYYTLVPSGASDTVQLTDNYTVHDRVYKVLLTSYDGVYETYWELENLGHEGRLQQYFDNPTDTLKNKNNGENVNANTCSGLSESDADMLGLSSTFTCTFKVTHKAITTGRCNPDSGHDITLNGNSCDDKAEGYQLFYFKVADPSNLFPDGNGEYGKNWSTDMINKVQSTDTYNPANETYKFVLTQGDMKLIKEYNDSRESEGGYSDFDFSCTCTDACVNCKSKFLEDYYSGTFYSGSGTFTPAGKKLNEIREKYGW